MSDSQTHQTLWVAHGAIGAVGTIRKSEDGYLVTMSGAEEPSGTFPTMEIAKRALHAKMSPGSDWPHFVEH